MLNCLWAPGKNSDFCKGCARLQMAGLLLAPGPACSQLPQPTSRCRTDGCSRSSDLRLTCQMGEQCVRLFLARAHTDTLQTIHYGKVQCYKLYYVQFMCLLQRLLKLLRKAKMMKEESFIRFAWDVLFTFGSSTENSTKIEESSTLIVLAAPKSSLNRSQALVSL